MLLQKIFRKQPAAELEPVAMAAGLTSEEYQVHYQSPSHSPFLPLFLPFQVTPTPSYPENQTNLQAHVLFTLAYVSGPPLVQTDFQLTNHNRI